MDRINHLNDQHSCEERWDLPSSLWVRRCLLTPARSKSVFSPKLLRQGFGEDSSCEIHKAMGIRWGTRLGHSLQHFVVGNCSFSTFYRIDKCQKMSGKASKKSIEKQGFCLYSCGSAWVCQGLLREFGPSRQPGVKRSALALLGAGGMGIDLRIPPSKENNQRKTWRMHFFLSPEIAPTWICGSSRSLPLFKSLSFHLKGLWWWVILQMCFMDHICGPNGADKPLSTVSHPNLLFIGLLKIMSKTYFSKFKDNV